MSLLEVCVDNVESALNAERGGASRIELCSALSEGGLTPSPGFLKTLKTLVKIPIFVMLRPRKGDFVYSTFEVDAMKEDAKVLKSFGADGFVFGALTTDGHVNRTICTEIMETVAPLPATFHRAFDLVQEPVKSLETIIELGFKRILTSGQEESAENGIPLIKKIVDVSKGRIIIMAGAGISAKNIHKIVSETGVREFHASARVAVKSNMTNQNKNCRMGSQDSGEELLITDSEVVKRILEMAKQSG